MKTLRRISRFASTIFPAVALVCAAYSSVGAPVTFNVDPAQSAIYLQGSVLGVLYNPQVPGSMVDTWGGTITGDLNGGVLTFNSGSSITALLHPLAPFLGNTNSSPPPYGIDNYGVEGHGFVTGYGFVSVVGAYRGLTLDIPSGSVQNGSAAAVSLQFTQGAIEFSGYNAFLGAFGGISGLQSAPTNNVSAAVVSLAPDGSGNLRLVLPLQFYTVGSNARIEAWAGHLVATAVPEPAAAVLLVFAAGACLVVRARRRS